MTESSRWSAVAHLAGKRRLRSFLRGLPRTDPGRPTGQAARLDGVARARSQPIRAPILGHACIGYDLVIHDGLGREALRETRIDSFILDSGAQAVLVDTGGAVAVSLRIAERLRDFPGLDEGERARYEAFEAYVHEADRRRRAQARSLGRFAYEIGLLVPGDRVVVGGIFIEEVRPDGEASGARHPPTALVARAGADFPLFLTNELR